jgi:hypothetical protein
MKAGCREAGEKVCYGKAEKELCYWEGGKKTGWGGPERRYEYAL